ncbi:glycerol kinase GlpK [Halanaerobacter jeridensis]|uniref:glycerol kinase n=1 Tax=Halanaerobacter jeridensis TaxID=706427 RepID=A0A938XVP5_9FIRM|nr:glycerol kinase GlpK [Halanaerobacter jeridensis]MBM7557156.1 glycerol kinase [Halanaerobacter jeridensis]
MEEFMLAIEQNTSKSKAVLLDRTGEKVSSASKEVETINPKSAWVECDPNQLWGNIIGVIADALAKSDVDSEQIAGIGIANQRETTIVWDVETGEAIYNAISWQDKRTNNICKELKERGLGDKIKEKTGLMIGTYFSAPKIEWILDNVEGAKKKAKEGKLRFGTIDSWLIWKLSGGNLHITDYTNASRTMLYNINELNWDSELLDIFSIPKTMLPEVKSSSEVYGTTASHHFFGHNIPIAAAVGDRQASVFGHGCFEPGIAKSSYGQGGFVLMNTGSKLVKSNNGLLTTIALAKDGEINYALEGSIFTAQSALEWLKDEMNLIEGITDAEYFANKVTDTDGVYFVPSFNGLAAPYWDLDAQGTIVGLTRGTNKNHIIRAVLEGIAYRTRDIIEVMEQDSKICLEKLKVDCIFGQDFLVPFQANILGCNIEYNEIDTTTIGVGYLAGLAVDYWQNKEEILDSCGSDYRFEPEMTEKVRNKLYKRWEKAISKARI